MEMPRNNRGLLLLAAACILFWAIIAVAAVLSGVGQ